MIRLVRRFYILMPRNNNNNKNNHKNLSSTFKACRKLMPTALSPCSQEFHSHLIHVSSVHSHLIHVPSVQSARGRSPSRQRLRSRSSIPDTSSLAIPTCWKDKVLDQRMLPQVSKFVWVHLREGGERRSRRQGGGEDRHLSR